MSSRGDFSFAPSKIVQMGDGNAAEFVDNCLRQAVVWAARYGMLDEFNKALSHFKYELTYYALYSSRFAAIENEPQVLLTTSNSNVAMRQARKNAP